jgi:Spy/CpxP family protein refolding chaperone
MITRLCYAILLSALLVMPNLADAQDMPAGKWWYNPRVVKALNLTKPEVRQIDRLYAQNRRQLIRLKANVEREQLELDNLLGRKNSDDAAVKKQFRQLESARAELSNARLQFVLGVRDIIGHERFQQLKAGYRSWQ